MGEVSRLSGFRCMFSFHAGWSVWLVGALLLVSVVAVLADNVEVNRHDIHGCELDLLSNIRDPALPPPMQHVIGAYDYWGRVRMYIQTVYLGGGKYLVHNYQWKAHYKIRDPIGDVYEIHYPGRYEQGEVPEATGWVEFSDTLDENKDLSTWGPQDAWGNCWSWGQMSKGGTTTDQALDTHGFYLNY